MVRPVSFKGFQKGFQGVSLRGFRGFQIFLWELCACIKYLSLGEETTEYSEILTNVKDYVKLVTAQFITGVNNIDSDWDSYLGDLERYNVNRFVELYQKGYDSIYKTAE